MKSLLTLFVCFTLSAPVLFAQTNLDITPTAATSGTRYENLTLGKNGSLYTIKNVGYEHFYLMEYKNGAWQDISPVKNGWTWLLHFAVDGNNTLYCYGAITPKEFRMYRRKGDQWDTLSTDAIRGNIQRLWVSRNGDLFAGGIFKSNHASFYAAQLKDDTWMPIAPSAEHPLFKQLEKDNYGVGELGTDEAGNFYMSLARFGQHYNNFILQWNNKQWVLFDTTQCKLDAALKRMVVDKKGVVYLAGMYKNANGSYYLPAWENGKWNTAYSTKDYIEDIALDADDKLYAAGWTNNSNGYLIQYLQNGQWVDYAACKTYYSKIVLDKDAVYAIVKSSAHIYRLQPLTNNTITSGNGSTTGSTTQPHTDIKIREVWDIYTDFTAAFNPKFKDIKQMLELMLKSDAKGNFLYQSSWSTTSINIQNMIPAALDMLDTYTTRLNRLNLAKNDNYLADDLLEVFKAYRKTLTATDDLMEQTKLVYVTQRTVDQMTAMETANTALLLQLKRLNDTKTNYQKQLQTVVQQVPQTQPDVTATDNTKQAGGNTEPAIEVKTKTHTFNVYSGWQGIFKDAANSTQFIQASYGKKKPAEVFKEAPEGWLKDEPVVSTLYLKITEQSGYSLAKAKQDFLSLAIRRSGLAKDKVKLLAEDVTLSDGSKGQLLFYVCKDSKGMVGGYYMDCELNIVSTKNKNNVLSYRLFMDGGCPDLPQKDYAAWLTYFKKVLVTIKPI